MARALGIPALLVALIAPSGAFALPPGLASLELTASSASATIELPGELAADLTIGFEEALGLSEESLGVSARVVSATELVGRLAGGVSPASGFPVVVSIEPPADGPLSFAGLVSIDLHTHNLSFVPNTPLRLFRSDDGGPFVDVTASMGTGSYRVRGSTGDFCEFLIVADTRDLDAVIAGKFSALQAALDADPNLANDLVATLQSKIDASAAAYAARQYVAAIGPLQELDAVVREASGAGVPDVWRSAGDLSNTAGALRAAAATLRFSLDLRASSGTL